MCAWYGAVDQLYSFVRLCKFHTIEDHVLCHTTVGSSTNIIKAEESRRLHVVVLVYWRVCSMYTHSLLYVLDNAVTQSTSRKTTAGRLLALCTYLQPWRGTARVLQSLRTCTPIHECSSKAVTCHANSTGQAASNNLNIYYVPRT